MTRPALLFNAAWSNRWLSGALGGLSGGAAPAATGGFFAGVHHHLQTGLNRAFTRVTGDTRRSARYVHALGERPCFF